MSIWSEEQLALLESMKGTPYASTPAPPPTPPARTVTSPSPSTFIDRDVLPVPEVAQTIGCGVDDVLSILRRLGYMRKTASSRLTVGEAEAVRLNWESASSSAERPSVRLGALASELHLDVHVLALEARRAGIPVQGDRGAFMLFEVEAEYLRKSAASIPRKVAPPTPVKKVGGIGPEKYRPRADGKMTLEDYDALKPAFAADLVLRGYLPQRQQVKGRPRNVWPQILAHRKALLAEALTTAERQRQYRVVNGISKPSATAKTLTAPLRIKAPSGSNPILLTGALKPPKPAFAVDIQRAQASRVVSTETNPERHSVLKVKVVAPQVRPLETTIGKNSQGVADLLYTLNNFAPKDHAVLFSELDAVLDLDERISRALPAGTARARITGRALRGLIRLVCNGKFGLFAYADVSNTIAKQARAANAQSPVSSMAVALRNFQPMSTGLFTDLGRRRFIFWSVESDGTQLATVAFDAVLDWLEGIQSGTYLPLEGRVIDVRSGAKLEEADHLVARFMVEAALKLRKGIKVQRTSPVSAEAQGRTYLAGRTPGVQQKLTYKPHTDWLVPVVIENGFTTAGLREGFFSNYGGRSAHEVREFMRRAPGTSRNAPKTIQVSAHTRGGYEVGDIGVMPTVTIVREKG